MPVASSMAVSLKQVYEQYAASYNHQQLKPCTSGMEGSKFMKLCKVRGVYDLIDNIKLLLMT